MGSRLGIQSQQQRNQPQRESQFVNASLGSRGPLVAETLLFLDGGMGHMLEEKLPPCVASEKAFMAGNLANVENPEVVIALHKDFLQAGADIITTNSFVTTKFALGKCGMQDRLGELLIAAGSCAQKAACALGTTNRERVKKVAGSLPPLQNAYYAESVGVLGDMVPLYEEIISHLAPYCDILLAETLSTSTEALAVLQAVRAQGWKKTVWLSWTLNDDLHAVLRGGETVSEACCRIMEVVRDLQIESLEAILVNCCVPQAIEAALPKMRQALPSNIKIGGYCNGYKTSTSQWLGNGTAKVTCDCDYDPNNNITPEAYVEHTLRWQELGACIIGGCCGLSPRHIGYAKSVYDDPHQLSRVIDAQIHSVPSTIDDSAAARFGASAIAVIAALDRLVGFNVPPLEELYAELEKIVIQTPAHKVVVDRFCKQYGIRYQTIPIEDVPEFIGEHANLRRPLVAVFETCPTGWSSLCSYFCDFPNQCFKNQIPSGDKEYGLAICGSSSDAYYVKSPTKVTHTGVDMSGCVAVQKSVLELRCTQMLDVFFDKDDIKRIGLFSESL